MRKIVDHTRGAARSARRGFAVLLEGLVTASANLPGPEYFKYPLF